MSAPTNKQPRGIGEVAYALRNQSPPRPPKPNPRDTPSSVTLALPVSDQLCADIMCTAIEGGIVYWCVADRIDRVYVEPNDNFDYVGFDAHGVELVDGDFGRVDYTTIRSGIARILSGAVKVRADLCAQVLANVHDADEACDADAADVIVQAGLFNDIVYG